MNLNRSILLGSSFLEILATVTVQSVTVKVTVTVTVTVTVIVKVTVTDSREHKTAYRTP